MASEGYAALGKAMRSIGERQRKWNTFSNVIGDIGSAVTFVAGQAQKQKTAWDEYEVGFKEIGGDVTTLEERPGFLKQLGQTLVPGGEKGFFNMPEGDVTIGEKVYKQKDIRQLGSMLDTPEGATYSPQLIERYKEKGVKPNLFSKDFYDTSDVSTNEYKKRSLYDSFILNNKNRNWTG